MSKTHWVLLHREPRKRGQGLETVVSILDPVQIWGAQLLAFQADASVLGIWEVEGARRQDVAAAVVMEWLARAKPSSMTVREYKAPRIDFTSEQGG